MRFFEGFPWSNKQSLNLDWLLAEMNRLVEYVKQYTAINTVSYGGIWDITNQYPQWSVVTVNNSETYLSRQPVPVGVPIENSEYWIKLADIDPLVAATAAKLANLKIANVVDFGAVPGGVVDNTAAFTAAQETGNPVYVPEGVYKVGLQKFIGPYIYKGDYGAVDRYDDLYPETPAKFFTISYQAVDGADENTPNTALVVQTVSDDTVADAVALWTACYGRVNNSKIFGANILAGLDSGVSGKLIGLELDYESSKGSTVTEGNALIINAFNIEYPGAFMLLGGVNGGSMQDGIIFSNAIRGTCLGSGGGIDAGSFINVSNGAFRDGAIYLGEGYNLVFKGANPVDMKCQGGDYKISLNGQTMVVGVNSGEALIIFADGRLGSNTVPISDSAGAVAKYMTISISGTDYKIPLHSTV